MPGLGPSQEPAGHVRVGQIVGAFGIHGELKVFPLTDFPERFDKGSVLYLDGEPRTIVGVHWHKGQARLRLDGIETLNDAESLKWRHLTIPKDQRPELEEDEYLALDLVGMDVFEAGQRLGSVSEVVRAPAHDLLRVEDALIPCVKQFVKRVDLETRRIDVELIDGLRPGEAAEEVR